MPFSLIIGGGGSILSLDFLCAEGYGGSFSIV